MDIQTIINSVEGKLFRYTWITNTLSRGKFHLHESFFYIKNGKAITPTGEKACEDGRVWELILSSENLGPLGNRKIKDKWYEIKWSEIHKYFKPEK